MWINSIKHDYRNEHVQFCIFEIEWRSWRWFQPPKNQKLSIQLSEIISTDIASTLLKRSRHACNTGATTLTETSNWFHKSVAEKHDPPHSISFTDIWNENKTAFAYLTFLLLQFASCWKSEKNKREEKVRREKLKAF